jgi:ankyrin repeat protein
MESLSQELVCMIAAYCNSATLSNLALTSRCLHAFFNPLLYESAILPSITTNNDHAAVLDIIKHAQEAGANIRRHQAAPQSLDGVSKATPLYAAAFNGMDNVVTYLLDHGAPIDTMSENRSPLFIALTRRHGGTAQLLMDRGASLHFVQNHALHVAVLANLQDIVRYLVLVKGCGVNITNGLGETPLHNAIEFSHGETIVPLLIELGADLEALVDEEGIRPCSPLALACEVGRFDTALTLLSRGVRVFCSPDILNHIPLISSQETNVPWEERDITAKDLAVELAKRNEGCPNDDQPDIAYILMKHIFSLHDGHPAFAGAVLNRMGEIFGVNYRILPGYSITTFQTMHKLVRGILDEDGKVEEVVRKYPKFLQMSYVLLSRTITWKMSPKDREDRASFLQFLGRIVSEGLPLSLEGLLEYDMQ